MKTWMFALCVATCTPAFAQNDFSGEWQVVRNQDNSENLLVGDWVGIPLNEAGIARRRSASGKTSTRTPAK